MGGSPRLVNDAGCPDGETAEVLNQRRLGPYNLAVNLAKAKRSDTGQSSNQNEPVNVGPSDGMEIRSKAWSAHQWPVPTNDRSSGNGVSVWLLFPLE